VKERLLAFWYVPAPPARLALLRIAFGAFATYYLSTRLGPLSNVASLQDWQFEPVGLAWFLARPLPSPVVLGAVVAALALAPAFALGFRYRVVAPAFALLLLWVTSYRNSWGMLYHTDNLLVFHALLLAATPAADTLSLDARRWRQQGRPISTDAEHGRYGWVIRALCVVTVIAYFIAGVAKLKLGGFAWAEGEQLRAQIAVDNLRKVMLGREASALGVWMVRHPPVFFPLALLTLFVELGAPLALTHRRAALAWTLAAWGFHVGVLASMDITFAYPLSFVAFLPFFRVERGYEVVLRFWRARRAGE
jgi:Vitamin K-dependent gamma-carboxylase